MLIHLVSVGGREERRLKLNAELALLPEPQLPFRSLRQGDGPPERSNHPVLGSFAERLPADTRREKSLSRLPAVALTLPSQLKFFASTPTYSSSPLPASRKLPPAVYVLFPQHPSDSFHRLTDV